MFPRGFYLYETPDLVGEHEYFDNQFMGKNLDSEFLSVSEIINGFAKCNFSSNPIHQDFYIQVSDLEGRRMFASLVLLIVCFIPMVVNNIIEKYR